MFIFLEFFILAVLTFFAYRSAKDLTSKFNLNTASKGKKNILITFLQLGLAYSGYFLIALYIVFSVQGLGLLAFLTCFPVYGVYLWSIMKKVNLEDVEEGLKENVFLAISGGDKDKKKAVRFFKSLWNVSLSPFPAGLIAVVYFSVREYEKAFKWFQVSQLMYSNPEGNNDGDGEDNVGWDNPIEEMVFSSMHAETSFRLGKLNLAEELWEENKDALKKSVVFLRADEEERKRIILGDDDTIDGLYLSMPTSELDAHPEGSPGQGRTYGNKETFGQYLQSSEDLASSVLWWEGVSLSPYMFDDGKAETDNSGEVYDYEADLSKDSADIVLLNYNNLTSDLLKKCYALTLFGLGFVKYIKRDEVAAENEWSEGYHNLSDFRCEQGLYAIEKFRTVEEAFWSSIKTHNPKETFKSHLRTNELTGELEPAPEDNPSPVSVFNEFDSERETQWLKNLKEEEASLYMYLCSKNTP